MKRVVVTGATGFVGANLTRRLLGEGHEVHLLLREKHNDWRIYSIKNDVYTHIVNFNDVDALSSTVSSIRPDWIFHLVAYGAYSSQNNLNQMIETNLVATANLVNVCVKLGFEIFINTGSSSEYGYKDHAPSEFEYLEPNSAYAITKTSATHYCSWVAQSESVCITTLRLYSVYGPYEEPTRLIPNVIIEGINGGLPPLASPNIARDFIFIDDILNAYQKVAENPLIVNNKVYNVGTGIQTNLAEVIEQASQILPIKVKPDWGSMENRRWDTNVWMADITRISKDLNWQPKYLFEDGFRKNVDWFMADAEMLAYYHRNRIKISL